MKRNLVVLIVLVFYFTFNCVANEIDTSSKISILAFPYMNGDVGVAYGLFGQYKISKRVKLSIGLKYNQSSVVTRIIDNDRLHHKYYADNPIQAIGYSVGVQYQVPWKYDFFKPCIYYDLTYAHLHSRTQFLFDSDNVNNGVPISHIWVYYYDLNTFENGIGLGGVAKILSKLSLNVRAGLGVNLIYNLPISEYKNGSHVNLAPQYSLGLQYDF